MKKFLIVALVAFGMNVKAQIALEQKYQKGNLAAGILRINHLTGVGYKYSMVDIGGSSGVIKLYNLNHSLYKTINVPVLATGKLSRVAYISDELFNTNPLDIEYFVDYRDNSNNNMHYTRIYDENGTLIFSVDSLSLPSYASSPDQTWEPIFYTSSGVKMILYRPWFLSDSAAFVYSLPGKLPCNDCANGVISGLANPNGGGSGNEMGIANSYPNPAINSTRIDYTFPSGVNQGEIVIYDLQGKEVKRYKVDKTFDHLLISTADIQAGTYFYQLQASGAASAGKKMVVIK